MNVLAERVLRHPAGMAAAVLFLVAAALYLPALGFGFVYDDRVQILTDGLVHDLSRLPDVLTFQIMGADVLDRNRPVHLLSLMLDSALWGRTAAGYHLTSLLLHAANGVLLFFLILRLLPAAGAARPEKAPGAAESARLAGARRWAALAGALLFAVHPVQAEAVCGVTFREDLLVTFFLLASFLLALKGFQGGRPGVFRFLAAGAVLLSLLLAAGSKETGAAGAPLLVLLWFFFVRRPAAFPLAGGGEGNPVPARGRGGDRGRAGAAGKTEGKNGAATPSRAAWWTLLGFALAGTALFYAADFALAPEPSTIFPVAAPRLGRTLGETLLIQPRIWAFEIQHVVWPAGYSAVYTIRNLPCLPLWGVLVILLVCAGAAGLLCRRRPAAWFGAAWVGLALLPVSNLVPIYNPTADRYLYLPLAGAGIWCAAVLLPVFAAKGPTVRTLGTAGLFCTAAWLALLTSERARVWENPLTLWTDTVRRTPDSPEAHNGLGYACLDIGRNAEAEAAWRRAIGLSRGMYADAWAGLALALEAQGRPAEADRALAEAVKLNPLYADPDRLMAALVFERPHAEKLRPITARFKNARGTFHE